MEEVLNMDLKEVMMDPGCDDATTCVVGTMSSISEVGADTMINSSSSLLLKLSSMSDSWFDNS